MFRLPEAWVWDFWLVDDGHRYHLFFLYASRALPDPQMRHRRASIGHAISDDLFSWRRVVDALVRDDPPAFDDEATWTGSVIRHPDGTWFMFYTGLSAIPPNSNRQTIGYATSPDLYTWTKHPGPILQADSRWYETYSPTAGGWHEEAFRDPWVFHDLEGGGWHMLITARANNGAVDDRGVIGHATSPDLRQWTLGPPLSSPGLGFGQLEVMQIALVDGQTLLMFSCLAGDLARRKTTGTTGGVWAAPGDSALGPFKISAAQQVTDNDRYVGRLIRLRDTQRWAFLCFHNDHYSGEFIGEIADPLLASWNGAALRLEPYSP